MLIALYYIPKPRFPRTIRFRLKDKLLYHQLPRVLVSMLVSSIIRYSYDKAFIGQHPISA
ncbi:hypothetical protein CSKR_103565 [Clonorchis sinensis]|uniref:Uncharacterized protein n=2 Tax=Clonorchis sinensis TaxID=79923 RepID=G7YGF8_CLOSI|nr:hypothetical protein CSKR_103565 [Clonorchis sinensis]GAA52041.1 hypothetical protein CLF_107257 [Clonorchis sinensis]